MMLIRPAVSKDAEAIAEVYLRSWVHSFGQLLPDSIVPRTLIKGKGLTFVDNCLVACHEEKIVGFIRMEAEEITQLYVNPDFQSPELEVIFSDRRLRPCSYTCGKKMTEQSGSINFMDSKIQVSGLVVFLKTRK